MITEMQKQMINSVGHNVEVEVFIPKGTKTIIGKCTNFTQPLDNEPEVAEMEIKTEYILYGIIENEIKSIKIID